MPNFSAIAFLPGLMSTPITRNPLRATSYGTGELMRKLSGSAPYLRISLSRGLFLNERHFNYDFGRIDPIRIGELRKKTHQAIERFAGKVF